jgi:hypothetical protein
MTLEPTLLRVERDQCHVGIWFWLDCLSAASAARLTPDPLGCSLFSAHIHTHYRPSLNASSSLILTIRTMNGGFA